MMKGMKIMILVMIVGLLVPLIWNIPSIKNSVHSVLDPTLGGLLKWNLEIGMLIIVMLVNLITTIIQKYGTDQESLKKLKAEQKLLQEEIKKFRNDPQKMMELNKKQMEFIPKTMDLTMITLLYTFIPFILLFRWFYDFFTMPDYASVKLWGFFSWFWFYLLFSIVFSTVWRKILKVV